MQESRLYSLDFLKFVAALMITNSHFQPLYEDVSPSLATFGVHGNALFFFVSGFLLMMGFEKKKSHGFLNWYKGRMRRLWPAVFIWVVVSAVVWKQTLTIGNLLLFDGYWFLQAIAVAYIVFFVILKIGKGTMGIRYDIQITALIPLHIFVYYLYKVASYSWCKKAFCSMIVGKIMSWIAALTLEIYIVQFSFVTNQFNSLFPLNVLLVFAIIVLAAYLLKVMTSLFLAVLSKEDLEWKEIVRL